MLPAIKVSVLFLFAYFFLVSCSIQKRVHRNGYHVEWGHQKKAVSEQAFTSARPDVSTVKEPLIADNATVETIIVPKQRPALIEEPDSCSDVLKLRNGDELKVQLVEIGEEFIKYKRCDNNSDAVLAIRKKSVSKVTYLNDGQENIVVLNEEGLQVANDTGVAMARPKQENKLVNISVILYAFFYVLSLALSAFVLISTITRGFLMAFVVVSLLGFILPTTLAFLALFQFKNEPGKYLSKWIPVYIIANKLVSLAILAVILLAINSTFLDPLVVIGLFVFLAALFIVALLPKEKEPSAK